MRERFFEFKGEIIASILAKKIGAEISVKQQELSDRTKIKEIKNIEDANIGDITFISNKKYEDQLYKTKASVCIVREDLKIDTQINKNLIFFFAKDPYFCFCKALNELYTEKKSTNNILVVNYSEDTINKERVRNNTYTFNGSTISNYAKIGKNVKIGSGVIIEDNVEIGDECEIGNNVVIKRGVSIGESNIIKDQTYLSFCKIGNECIIHPGARIGTDGFGFATKNGLHNKILHIGLVEIENYVEIGANSTIDRGSIKNTVIGEGTKIDNLVQIGHNVQIGKHCLIVAQVGIAGSTKIGNYVVLGGQVGVSGHIHIADKVQAAGQTGIIKNISEPGEIVGGTPSMPIKQWHKQSIYLKNIVNNKGKN